MEDKNRESLTNRERYIADTIIDGENCNINPSDLQQEKERIDAKFDQVFEDLQRERMEQVQVYENKVNDIKGKDNYKEEIYQEKIRQLMEDKAVEDRRYEEKIANVRNDMRAALTQLNGKVDQIYQERDVRLQIIDDKVEEVRNEKQKYNELYRLQLEKLRQDSEYKQNMERLKQERGENQEVHMTRQEELNRERQFRESDFSRSMERERNKALIRLHELEGFTVADEDPDVRGWKVIGRNGNEIGRIDELIVDKDAMKVRYLDINVDHNFIETDQDRHLLLPIGVAEIDSEHDQVFIPTIDKAIVSKIPTFSGDEVTRDYEETLLNVLISDDEVVTYSNNDFYDREHFNDRNFYNPRRHTDL